MCCRISSVAKKYELEFCKSERIEGFRSLGLSTYKDADADIVVRELIQNATDAAAKKRRKVTEVTFLKEEISLNDMPAKDFFQKSFAAAKDESRKRKQHQENGIIEAIERKLKGRSLDVLWVLDNGTGLDTTNMNDLLAEGNTGTETGSSGAYGVGHLTAFPASDLRYIVYGGVSKKESIISGHAILRSHEMGDWSRGADGYLRMPKHSRRREPMVFPSAAAVGGIWRQKIDYIAEKYGTGSFVCILAFNFFNDKKEDLKKDIFYAAATHFMPLIHRKQLVVNCHEDVLDHKNLQEVIEKNKPNQKSRGKLGVSGKKFFDVYTNLNSNRDNAINVDLGLPGEKARLFLKSGQDFAPTEIHLYRNGMWITNNVPQNSRLAFDGREPFNAVIEVDNKSGREAGELIKLSENPTHTLMSLKNSDMSARQKERLRNVLGKIQDKIASEAPKEKILDVIKSNFLKVELGPTGQPAIVKKPRVRYSNNNNKKKAKGKGRRGAKISYSPKGAPANILSSYKIIDGKTLQVTADALEDMEKIEVSFVRKSGSDLSCEKPEPDQCIRITKNSSRDGKKLGIKQHIPEKKDLPDKYVGLRLENVKKGSFELEMELATPPLPIFQRMKLSSLIRIKPNERFGKCSAAQARQGRLCGRIIHQRAKAREEFTSRRAHAN